MHLSTSGPPDLGHRDTGKLQLGPVENQPSKPLYEYPDPTTMNANAWAINMVAHRRANADLVLTGWRVAGWGGGGLQRRGGALADPECNFMERGICACARVKGAQIFDPCLCNKNKFNAICVVPPNTLTPLTHPGQVGIAYCCCLVSWGTMSQARSSLTPHSNLVPWAIFASARV